MDDFWKFIRNTSALAAIMGLCIAAGWALGSTIFGMETRLVNRIARLEAKVLDVKEDDESSTNDIARDRDEERNQNEIAVNDTTSGRLDNDDGELLDGSHFDDWLLEMPRDTVVVIEMTSSDLDPFLFLSRGQRSDPIWEPVAANDDGGDRLNARLTCRLARGDYTITANTYGNESGRYELSVTETNFGSIVFGSTTATTCEIGES